MGEKWPHMINRHKKSKGGRPDVISDALPAYLTSRQLFDELLLETLYLGIGIIALRTEIELYLRFSTGRTH